MDRLMGFVGLLVFIGIAWALSTNRKQINWKLVGWGLGIQFGFAILVLPDSFFNTWIKNLFNTEQAPGGWLFSKLNDLVNDLLSFTKVGTDFLISSSALGGVDPSYENFIFRVIPTILFFSSFMAILYHLGIIQKIVSFIAKIMAKSMGTSGAESLSAAANIFVGQTEAPLVIKPYVEKMTESELLAIMTGGMATVAGGIMAAYVAFLAHAMPDIAGHLIAASVMSAPAALVIAKILIPEDKQPETMGAVKFDIERNTANVIDAAAQGAGDGVKLAVNVAAMLLVFIALLAVINSIIGWGGSWFGHPDLTLQYILGKIMAPVAFIMGIPWKDAAEIGSLLGTKTIVNEFLAFKELAEMINQGADIDQKSLVITTYALCGFSNFSSIAIQIGGIGSIAPNRKKDLAKLGIKAVIAGSFACFMTASIAGILSPGKKTGTILASKGNQISTIDDTFHMLKKKLISNANVSIRRGHLNGAIGKKVTWRGQFFAKQRLGLENAYSVSLYFGIKDASAPNEVFGTEPNDFALFYLDKLPKKIIYTKGRDKIQKAWKDLTKGDILEIEGKLVKFQPSGGGPALFSIEEAIVKNIVEKNLK